MQGTRGESKISPENQRDDGVTEGQYNNVDVNALDGNYRSNDYQRTNNERRNDHGGYGGRNRGGRGRRGARNFASWREDRFESQDQQQLPYHREAGRGMHRGGGRGGYLGNHQGGRQKYRDPFPQDRPVEFDEGGRGVPERPPRRGGRGRDSYHQDRQYYSDDVVDASASNTMAKDTGYYTQHDTPTLKEPPNEAENNEQQPQGRPDFGQQRMQQRESREGYEQQGRRGRRGGYRGRQNTRPNRYDRYADDNANNSDSQPRGCGLNNTASCRQGPQENRASDSHGGSAPADGAVFRAPVSTLSVPLEREENAMLEVLPPGFKRRIQRAPHLRKNCFDENEILELFEHHHRQKGISLDNYDNIPVVIVPRDIMAVEDFSDLKVEPALMANIERCGYKKPTPVQRYGIPVAIAENDLMACAQTGSGKTAAFLIPMVQHILVTGVSPAERGVCRPIGLVMAPTRELALQIYDEVRKLAFRTDVFYDVVYGGTPYPTRFENDILVACPGRLKDIFDRGSLSFRAIKFLVLDEADRMLEMGFEEQIEYLVASRYTDMPKVDERQTLMFSATFPTRILNLARRYLQKQYYLLTVGRVGSTTKNITQIIEKVQESEKMDRLFELIYAHKKSDLVLIFVETKKSADDLHRELKKEHIPSSTIHGDRRQQDRERALAEFKSGETPILVATDVASRGLDIPDVARVIQFDLPSEMDDYVHRIGRTGRAGNKGVATSFYNRNNRKVCLDLYKYLREHEQDIPTWFREEAELVEGEAMLSRDFGVNRRRGGGGGSGYGNSEAALGKDSEEKWGSSASGTSRGRGHGKASLGVGDSAAAAARMSNLTTDIDDGGF